MFKPISESLNEMREMELAIVVGAIFRHNPHNLFEIAFWETLWDSMDATDEYRANRISEINSIRITITSINKIDENIESITWFDGKNHQTASYSMFMESFVLDA